MSDDFETSRSKSVTIMDVARVSGVSYSTVSRVLNGFEFVKDSTRQRVLAAAEQLGYVANLPARSLAGGRSRIIGLLLPRLDNSYISEIIRGVDEVLGESDYDLMLYTTHRQQGKEAVYVRAITNRLAEGLLLLVPMFPSLSLKALPSQDFPHVLIDQSDKTNQSSVVYATNSQGAYDATNYLIGLGHERIGFIRGQMEIQSAVDRLAAYKAALADNGLPFDETLAVDGDFYAKGGYAGATELLALANRPTAIFAANDLSAIGAMDAIRDHGLRIPDDISVIGFDDIPQASLTYPKLTTVRQPLIEMGRIAATNLLEQIEKPGTPPKQVTLATELVIRDSCTDPRRR